MYVSLMTYHTNNTTFNMANDDSMYEEDETEMPEGIDDEDLTEEDEGLEEEEDEM